MRGIVKRFPGVVANAGVDLELRQGEIHALLGENGAGKSTLVQVLAGIQRPDAGTIELFGEPARWRSPRDAIARGVGMVHQQFMLVPTLTCAENVVLGLREQGWWTSPNEIAGRVGAFAAAQGFALEPSTPVWQLSVGEQQRVEIVKALYRGARVLVLDEPTAVLCPHEVEALCDALRAMARAGRSVVLISHKLAEVLAIADRITVLRRGRVVAAGLEARATNAQALAELMVGQALAPPRERPTPRLGPAVLTLSHLSVRSDKGLLAVRGVELCVRAGELVGLAGVAGNGQRELAEAIAGMRARVEGAVCIAGHEVPSGSPRAAMAAGLAYVPEDRAVDGTAATLSLAENLVLKRYQEPRFGRRGLLDRAAVAEHARERMQALAIAAPSEQTPAGKLSGGNLQKLILARELASGPRLLVAAQPTRGLDVGATEAVHAKLRELREAGAGVLVVSEDLDELCSLADRIVVMSAGRFVGELDAAEATAERLGLLLGGAASRGPGSPSPAPPATPGAS